ncbi:uncharacterized protein [Miscanthus floridulus]|uniref:uncharacterized protein n=1 Tax=Miscanthus floridulus TaxID=154761 RepID=UPI003459D70F
MVDLAPSPSDPCPPSKGCSDRDIAHVVLVVVLVVVAIAAMFLLHILGSLRRQSSHGLLRNIVMGVNTLSYPLVSYTIGRMNSSNCYVDDYAVWAVFMLLLLGSTDNLTAFRLDDVNNWKGIFVKHLFKGFLVVYIVVHITLLQNGDPFPYLRPLLAILSVGVLKCYVRIASMRMVSKSYLNKNMKVIAEYMQQENNLQQPGPFNPVTMEGYKYMVAGEKYCIKHPGRNAWYNEDGFKVTTVEQIWQCTRNLLLPERGGMLLKDVCLSMALSKMLNRRFAGFKLSEAGLETTHDFVFKGLLVAGDKPYLRAFRVIEEELVFVHDIYYTRYSYLYQKGRYLALCLPTIMISLCCWLIYLIVKHRSPTPITRLTIFITVVLAFLEAYQLYLYVASGWFKVALIRSYVTTPLLQRSGCFHEMIIGLLLRLKAFRPWKNRLGQYCILWELGRKSRVRTCLHYATLRLLEKKAKEGRKRSVKLSENVKKAVVDSLLRSNGHLTNGVASLRNNGVDNLFWACDATATDGSVTRTILVWHIATTLCKHQLDAQAKKEEEEDAKRGDTVTTATTLSQYCMHLLAFAPDLLPDHSSISESILDESIKEAGDLIKGCNKENCCEELMKNGARNGDDYEALSPVVKGVQLARHLIEDIQEPALRWKVLSEFWAEMMLAVRRCPGASGSSCQGRGVHHAPLGAAHPRRCAEARTYRSIACQWVHLSNQYSTRGRQAIIYLVVVTFYLSIMSIDLRVGQTSACNILCILSIVSGSPGVMNWRA